MAAGAAEDVTRKMAFTHPIIALALGAPFYRRNVSGWIWLWGAALTALPDIDLFGYRMGVPYSHMMGHRGFTHSLVFAALIALLTAQYSRASWKGSRSTLWLFFFLCAASHGVLDGLTDGGLGVAYFSPIENSRYFLPWRPIPVAPLNPRLIFSEWGARVVASELLWIWLPTLLTAAVIVAARWSWLRGRDSDNGR